MSPWWIVALLVVVLFGLYLSQVAGRLDRLHHRIEGARLGLEVQSARRSALVIEIAAAGVVDPATSLVLADAPPPRPACFTRRSRRRIDCGEAQPHPRALSAAFSDPEDIRVLIDEAGDEAATDLEGACRRVQLARRFHNDAVRACLALRRRRLVRVFRLAGHTPWPDTVEFDDAIPDGFGAR